MNRSTPIRVVVATDDRYAALAAACVRSVIDSLDGDGGAVEVAVLACDLRAWSRRRLAASWRDPRCEVRFLDVNPQPFAGLPITSPVGTRVTTAAYLRLAVADVLPQDWTRAVYLDVDTITRRSLAQLWSTDLGGNLVGAVRDDYIPTVASRYGLRRWKQLGLHPDAPYFNSGVMLIDVDGWRRQQVYQRTIGYLRTYRDDVQLFDQDALNAVLHDRWLPLDTVWNVTGYWRDAGRRVGRYTSILDEACIRHFAGPLKPWERSRGEVPGAELFFAALNRTAWSTTTF